MGKIEDAIKKYEEDPNEEVYYTYDNRPDYSVNQETGEITIFQYGYFGHTNGKLFSDLEKVDYNDNINKQLVFEEIDNRIEKLIDKYNEAKAHNYNGQNDSTLSEYYTVKGKLDALMDLREELIDDNFWDI